MLKIGNCTESSWLAPNLTELLSSKYARRKRGAPQTKVRLEAKVVTDDVGDRHAAETTQRCAGFSQNLRPKFWALKRWQSKLYPSFCLIFKLLTILLTRVCSWAACRRTSSHGSSLVNLIDRMQSFMRHHASVLYAAQLLTGAMFPKKLESALNGNKDRCNDLQTCLNAVFHWKWHRGNIWNLEVVEQRCVDHRVNY